MADWRKHGLPYCSLYVIAPEGHWPSKIGISTNARKRVVQLQTSHWKMMVVSRCYWVEGVTAARRLEAKVHETLKGMSVYLNGEWFDRSPEQAAEIIEFEAMLMGVELHDTIDDPIVLEAVGRSADAEYARYTSMQSQMAYGEGGPIYNWRTGRPIK